MGNVYYDKIMDSLNSSNNIVNNNGILLQSDYDKIETMEYIIRISRMVNLIKSKTFKNNFNKLSDDKQEDISLALIDFLDTQIIDGYLPIIISELAECDISYITDKFEVIDKLVKGYFDLIKLTNIDSNIIEELKGSDIVSNRIYDKIINRIDESEKIVENGDKIISHFDLKLLDNITSRIRKIRFIRLIRSEKFKNNFIKLSNDDQLYIYLNVLKNQ